MYNNIPTTRRRRRAQIPRTVWRYQVCVCVCAGRPARRVSVTGAAELAKGRARSGNPPSSHPPRAHDPAS